MFFMNYNFVLLASDFQINLARGVFFIPIGLLILFWIFFGTKKDDPKIN